MSDNSEIFSSQVPGQKRFSATMAKQAEAPRTESQPKRKYTRKSPPISAAKSSPRKVVAELISEERFGSYALEYVAALTRLLELLSEPSRERLVNFIIDHKII